MKNILFLVTGKTTPIITETVWALACDPELDQPWIPDEIHVMSTEEGLDHIRMDLFDNAGAAIFDKFKQDYPQLKNVYFNGKDCLHVFADKDGNKLDDLRTPEDNEVAADIICEKVREFTEDENTSLHVSIAGGRKTMGFYAGYALSLYGRAQDAMSHVLVEEKYENAIGFFYPTPSDSNTVIKNRAGKPVKTSEAKVWLANIPFVRMRDAIIKKHQIKQDTSFSSVVNKINESFKDIKLSIDVHNKKVTVNNKFIIDDLLPVEFALLHWFADRRANNQAGIVAPTANINSKDMSTEQFNYIMQISEDYMQFYNQVKDKLWKLDYEAGDVESLDIDKKFFEVKKSNLKSKFQKVLGVELASKIEIKNDKKGQPFYLDLAPEAIEIVGLLNSETLF